MKRLTDIFFAAICLVLFSPLILLCYLIIKIGGGPAFYKQERIGKGGRPFYIYKFRSMVIDAEKEGEELLQQENDSLVHAQNVSSISTRLCSTIRATNVSTRFVQASRRWQPSTTAIPTPWRRC